MVRIPRTTLAVCAALALATGALAQAPKLGPWYEDASDLGFKVRVPKDWDFIPPAPDEGNLIGKYDPPMTKYINVSASEVLFLHCWLVKFDRREEAPEFGSDGENKRKKRRRREAESLTDWMDSGRNISGSGWRVEEEKDRAINKVDATEYSYVGEADGGSEIRAHVVLYHLSPDVDVALIGNGPGGKKWRKYGSAFQRMAKSFKPVEVERIETDQLGAGSARAQKKAMLERAVATQPGWELLETPNYFIVSNNDDKEFLDELMDRLEAIRAIYEVDYSPEMAETLRQKKAEDANAKPKRKSSGGRSVAKRADPMELSRTSVVRVCANRAQYHSYGGPNGSAGYWNSADEELVIYDDKAGGGRRNTWATLNHEAFHQYIFYFYGNLAPHSWYNEGTGDYYSGFQIKNGRFQLKPFDWRVPVIKEAIRNRAYVPLQELVRFTQREYYGSNKYGARGGQNYAQGWSVIYFLRTGEKSSRDWNPRWSTILETYLEKLATDGDLDAAVDAAFAGVDFAELEGAWLEYTQ